MLGDASGRPVLGLSLGVPTVVGVRFTTDGSGVATVLSEQNGRITIAKATNTYTITLPGTWAVTQACVVVSSLVATVNCVVTTSPTAGTLTLAFSGAIASATVDVMLIAELDNP